MKYYNLFALAGLLTLSACSKQEGPLNTETNTSTLVDNREKVSLALDLSGEARMIFDGAQDKNRGITYSIDDDAKGANIAPLTAKTLYSIAVISDAQGTETHTFYLEWNKSTEDGRYYVKEIGKNDIDGKPIAKLDLNKEWFISGVLTPNRNKIDLKARKLRFSPNADIGPVNNSSTPATRRSFGKNQVENDIPLYFEWTKLSVPTVNAGTDAIATAKSSQALGTPSIKIRPMGTLMRIKVRNDNDYPVRVKSLRIFSSVFTTKDGAIDLNNYNKKHKAEEIKYVPDNVSEDDLYPLSNLDLQAKQAYDHDFLIWGVPVKPKTDGGTTYFSGRAFSQIIFDVKRLQNGVEQDKPKMDALYVWGSEYNNPKQATRLRITASIKREMSVLEYFANGYWDGTKNANPFTTDTNKYVFKGNHELVAMADTDFPDGYKPMKYNDARLLYPGYLNSKSKIFTDRNITTPVVEGSYNAILPGESTGTQLKDSVQQINGVLYALRYDDGKEPGKRKHLSAFRYNYANATIESVYLGPTFKGVFSDLLKESFWRNHANDIVKLTYGATKTKFFRRDNNKPVEWYFERNAEKYQMISSPILISSIQEDSHSSSPFKRIVTAYLSGTLNNRYTPGGINIRDTKANYDVIYTTLQPERLDSDPEFPPGEVVTKTDPTSGTYYGPAIHAVHRAPVILVKKNADY